MNDILLKASAWGRSAVLVGTLFLTACGVPRYEPAADGAPRAVVVWISIDGVRPDYLERADTPFFDRMMREGAYSLALAPMFPSLTFPNHVAQSTGAPASVHGVPLNSFYDRIADRSYFYPGFARILQAEPIWNTAERQGRRTAVYDWVLSHQQRGPHATSFSGSGYDAALSDKDRIRPLLNAWRKDEAREPLRLLMGYMVAPDKVGHESGPDAPEMAEVMREMDRHIYWFTQQAIRLFERRMGPNDELYILVTSDHGMSTVHTAVNPRELTGLSREEDAGDEIILMTTGNLAHIFLHKLSEDQRQIRAQEILARIAPHSFATAYRRDELPEQWSYAHPDRVGDIVIKLATGHTFSRRTPGLTSTAAAAGAPVGMHGYDVANNPEMNGIALVWRYRQPIGGIDLGSTHSLQLHATVAEWLGIEPSDQARPDPIHIL
jgi:predicted AlkP superfamily pyrophosphatase or phosphodiesterase